MSDDHPVLYVTDQFGQSQPWAGECLLCQRDALRARLAEVDKTLRPLVDDDNRPVEALARAAVDLVTDAQEELRKCQQDAIQLQARLAEAERAIESAGRCLVMSNNGKAEALNILRSYKQRTTDSASAIQPTGDK